MRSTKILIALLCMSTIQIVWAQEKNETNKNSSQETVTKIIRIKGANGEEKIIKKKEVITKKGKIKFNPNDEDKTNQSALYTDEEVQVQKSNSSSDDASYTMIPDAKGYRLTLLSKSGNKTVKARSINKNYYIVNLGNNDNGVGHFDKDKNFILEQYDAKTDNIMTTVYKKN